MALAALLKHEPSLSGPRRSSGDAILVALRKATGSQQVASLVLKSLTKVLKWCLNSPLAVSPALVPEVESQECKSIAGDQCNILHSPPL